jgi:hypothetical protein
MKQSPYRDEEEYCSKHLESGEERGEEKMMRDGFCCCRDSFVICTFFLCSRLRPLTLSHSLPQCLGHLSKCRRRGHHPRAQGDSIKKLQELDRMQLRAGSSRI